MTNEEFNEKFDAIVSSDTVDLDKAATLKTEMEEHFKEFKTSTDDNAFYVKQIDDLKRQNRQLYMRTNPVVDVQPKQDEPTKTPYEKFSEAFSLEDLGKLF